MKTVVYPGSFNPFHAGHLDVVEQALKVFDKVVILVADNPNKKYSVKIVERMSIIKEMFKDVYDEKYVKIDGTIGTVIGYCVQNNIDMIIKGIRNGNDLDAEIEQKYFNSELAPNIQTVYFTPSLVNKTISSTLIRGLKGFNSKFIDNALEVAYKNTPSVYATNKLEVYKKIKDLYLY